MLTPTGLPQTSNAGLHREALRFVLVITRRFACQQYYAQYGENNSNAMPLNPLRISLILHDHPTLLHRLSVADMA
jgi:hypothetical protein